MGSSILHIDFICPQPSSLFHKLYSTSRSRTRPTLEWLEAEEPVAEITPPFPSHVLFENTEEYSKLWAYKQGIAETNHIISIPATITSRKTKFDRFSPPTMSHLQYYAYEGAGVHNRKAYHYNQAVRIPASADRIELAGQGIIAI